MTQLGQTQSFTAESAATDDGWLVISDRSVAGVLPDDILTGLLVVEFALPLAGSTLLLDHTQRDGPERGLSLLYQPEIGLILRHRRGSDLVRHTLPCRLTDRPGTARLSLGFDVGAGRWDMRLDMVDAPDQPAQTAGGQGGLAFGPRHLARMADDPARQFRHASVLWFGLARGLTAPARLAWIGLRSPVMTPRGPVAAGRLRKGDMVSTVDDGALPLLGVRRMALPACGSFAPVLLRAPFLTDSQDVLVSADQMLVMQGPAVEYLFGEDEVLIAANAIVDGRTALMEQRQIIASSVALLFDRAALLQVDGCRLLSALPKDKAPRRCLQDFEARMLMTQLGRGGARRRV